MYHVCTTQIFLRLIRHSPTIFAHNTQQFAHNTQSIRTQHTINQSINQQTKENHYQYLLSPTITLCHLQSFFSNNHIIHIFYISFFVKLITKFPIFCTNLHKSQITNHKSQIYFFFHRNHSYYANAISNHPNFSSQSFIPIFHPLFHRSMTNCNPVVYQIFLTSTACQRQHQHRSPR